MFHEVDIVLQNLPAVLLHKPEYFNNEVDLGCREKAEGLLAAHLHPCLKVTEASFCNIFAAVCATNKKVLTTRGAQVDAVRGLINVLYTQLVHTRHHIIPRGCKESFSVEVEGCPIKGC